MTRLYGKSKRNLQILKAPETQTRTYNKRNRRLKRQLTFETVGADWIDPSRRNGWWTGRMKETEREIWVSEISKVQMSDIKIWVRNLVESADDRNPSAKSSACRWARIWSFSKVQDSSQRGFTESANNAFNVCQHWSRVKFGSNEFFFFIANQRLATN